MCSGLHSQDTLSEQSREGMYAFLATHAHITQQSTQPSHLMRSHATLTPPPTPLAHHPTPITQHPAPSTQHPAPNTHHPSPNTQHPRPSTLALESGRSRGSEATPYGGSPLLSILRTCGCQGEQTVQSVTQVVVTQGGARDDTGGFSFRRGSADTATPHHASGYPDAQTHAAMTQAA